MKKGRDRERDRERERDVAPSYTGALTNMRVAQENNGRRARV
jgi:hypothetical protein